MRWIFDTAGSTDRHEGARERSTLRLAGLEAHRAGALTALGLALTLTAGCEPTDDIGPTPCPAIPGELVLTEILSDPEGSDTGREWIEIYNAGPEPVDLRGMRLYLLHDSSEKRHTIRGDGAIILNPGQYGVLSSGPLEGGQLYVYGDTVGTMTSAGSTLQLVCDDGTVLDEACYGDACDPVVPAPGDGQSFGLNGKAGAPTALANDDPSAWALLEPTPALSNPEAEVIVLIEEIEPSACTSIVTPLEADITITEVFSNPAGADGGQEWYEFYIASGGCVEVTGMLVSGDDITPTGSSTMSQVTGATLLKGPGYYLVSGPAARLDGAPVAQFLTSPALGNTDGVLAFWFDKGGTYQLVASAHYGDAVEQVSSQFDGEGWCPSPQPASDGSFYGSPGAPNPQCGQCYCYDELDQLVGVTSPEPGEVIITEIMPNTPGKEGDNADTEWFEVLLRPSAPQPRSFACVAVANKDISPIVCDASSAPDCEEKGAGTGTPITNPDLSCLLANPGERVVFGRSEDVEANGGVVVDVLHSASAFSGSGGVSLQRADGVILDVVSSYGTSTDGVSRQLDPSLEGGDLSGNDEPDAWCNSQPDYKTDYAIIDIPPEPEEGEPEPVPEPVEDSILRGTPGEPNHGCTDCVCRDEGGGVISTPMPAAGEIMLTEIMANVPGGETENKMLEWFELTLLPSTSGARSLGCLEYAPKVTTNPKPIPNEGLECRIYDPGDIVLFGRTAEAALNAGLTVDIVYDGSEFTGSGGFLLTRPDGIDEPDDEPPAEGEPPRTPEEEAELEAEWEEFEAKLLDRVDTYGDADDGVARQVSKATVDASDAAANDDATGWCDATDIYEASWPVLGTPGATNRTCP